jgi:hypothetical protein
MLSLICAGCGKEIREISAQHSKDPNQITNNNSNSLKPFKENTTNIESVRFAGVIQLPEKGKLFHGVHPGSEDGDEVFNPENLEPYVKLVTEKNKPYFVYFSDEWGFEDEKDEMNPHDFPQKAVNTIIANGSIPFIRLMLRTSSDAAYECKGKKCQEKHFTLDNILGWDSTENKALTGKRKEIHDKINKNLEAWGASARSHKGPLIIEFGTEVNNHTFHWNGKYNGKNTREGAILFQRAFRHIVKKIEGDDLGKSNITWVFHVTAESDPVEDTENLMSKYFPDGTPDDPRNYVDWVGVSIYAATDRKEACKTFAEQLNTALIDSAQSEGLKTMAKRGNRERPIFILEFGAPMNSEHPAQPCKPPIWTRAAFETIFEYAKDGTLSGFSWWSERFKEEGKKLEFRPFKFDARYKQIYLNAVQNQQKVISSPNQNPIFIKSPF